MIQIFQKLKYTPLKNTGYALSQAHADFPEK